MKRTYVLAFSMLGVLAAFAGGVVVSAEGTEPVSELHQLSGIESQLLETLKVPEALSDSRLRRPL